MAEQTEIIIKNFLPKQALTINQVCPRETKMVEAAKAINPFALKTPTLDITNHCPHMARLGVCLEPAMCFLIHQVADARTQAQMTTAAKEFNPFAASSSASKEFVPV